jgi:hypothetical protein
LVRTRVLRFMPFGLSLFLGPSVSPSVRPLGRSRGLRSPAEVRSSLRLRFRSTFLPPSGSGARRWARALRLLPFLPASLLACFSPVLRLSPPRLRSEAALWHAFGPPSPPACACGSVWPSCWLLTQPSGNRPEACASADCSGLAAFTSCGCQLPQSLWTTGLSIRKNLRSAESALSPAPACVRLAPHAALEPASQSCLGVPVIAEVQLAPRSNLPGLPFRMVPLRASILPVPSEPFSKRRLAPLPLAQFFRTCLPVPDLLRLACALHALSVRPACLRVCPSDLRPPVFAPAPPRARSAN